MPEHIFHSTTLLAKRQLTTDVLELRFERPSGFVFQPGQFVQFRVPEGEKFVLRSYSISSSEDAPYLEFAVKILPDGKASKMFSEIVLGEKAEISSPKGLFVVKPDTSGRCIFIATGTGLAPVMSMVRSYVPKMVPVTLTSQVVQGTTMVEQATVVTAPTFDLLFGVRFKEDLFWVDELRDLQVAYSHFSYRVAVSRPENWNGLSGRVTEHLPVIDTAAHYYLCGSLEMVKEVKNSLTTLGVNPKQLHFEIF